MSEADALVHTGSPFVHRVNWRPTGRSPRGQGCVMWEGADWLAGASLCLWSITVIPVTSSPPHYTTCPFGETDAFAHVHRGHLGRCRAPTYKSRLAHTHAATSTANWDTPRDTRSLTSLLRVAKRVRAQSHAPKVIHRCDAYMGMLWNHTKCPPTSNIPLSSKPTLHSLPGRTGQSSLQNVTVNYETGTSRYHHNHRE